MRKTHFFIPLFVALLLAILAVCCQDDIGISSSTDEAFSLEDAKAFFETGVDELSVGIRPPHGHGKETKSQALELPRLIAPVWTKAERWTERDGNMVVVEIPLYVSNGDRVIRRMWLEGKTKTETLRAYSKLLIRHFKQENVTVSNVVTFIADKRFSGVDKDITELRYDKWKKFSGIVIYTLPDGRFINGYRLVNGEMTHRLFLQDTTIKQASEESDLLMQYDYEDRLGATVLAYNTDTEFYCGTCDYWHPFEEGCEYEYVVNGVSYCRNCELPKTDCICDSPSAVCGECFQNPCVCHGSTVETCSVCHKEPGSCICPKLCGKCGRLGCTGTCDACSNCGARGCDGNCKTQTNQAVPLPNKLKVLFSKNINLTIEQLEKIESIIDSISKNCPDNSVYSYLSEGKYQFNGVKISEERTYAMAAYIPNKGNLVFYGEEFITYNGLNHEMFHLYQHKRCGEFTSENKGYREYELKLYNDITFYVDVMKGDALKDYNKREEWIDVGWGAELSRGYKTWLSEITNEGTTVPDSVSVADFRKYAEIFGEKSRSYPNTSYNYDIDYAPDALNAMLTRTKRNCQ